MEKNLLHDILNDVTSCCTSCFYRSRLHIEGARFLSVFNKNKHHWHRPKLQCSTEMLDAPVRFLETGEPYIPDMQSTSTLCHITNHGVYDEP